MYLYIDSTDPILTSRDKSSIGRLEGLLPSFLICFKSSLNPSENEMQYA